MTTTIKDGKLTGEKVRVILPHQYANKWKNDEGKVLFVVIYVEVEGLELKKVFVPASDFKSLAVKSFMGNEVVFDLDEDDEGRTILYAIKKVLDSK